jgi:HNH endonuclease
MRGQTSKPGDIRVAKNGYHYTRTVSGWRLTHHIMAEQLLGRPLHADEIVRFKDANRKNLEADNIIVVKKGAATAERTRARLIARVAELEAQLAALR